jgi:shikimate dehydrogenase
MNITAKTKLCMVIGDPVENSLSPQIHNAAYEHLGIDSEFVYVSSRVASEDLAAFVAGAKAMGVRGFACKKPHKQAVIDYLDEIDETARKIGAVNTVVNNRGRLKGYNTDWIGITAPLESITSLKDKEIALLGAGGASRAAAYGVINKGAKLTIYNRTLEKAHQLAEELGCQARSLDDQVPIKSADVIINTTSVGEPLAANETPLPKEFIDKGQIVFDIVYGTDDTRLLREARQQGAQVIRGTDMLLHQGMAQFKLFTGREAPEDAMRQAFAVALGYGGRQ